VSATAERDGLSLICVIMGAKTRDSRNAAAASLLDYGFANFATYRAEGGERTLPLVGGTARELCVRYDAFCATVPKGKKGSVTCKEELPETVSTPVGEGEAIGRMVYMLDGEEIGSVDVVCAQSAPKIDFRTLFRMLLCRFFII
jgi:D-alanyl-D-alanine carboxypeptidase (penicillin-binding protein 5/6)